MHSLLFVLIVHISLRSPVRCEDGPWLAVKRHWAIKPVGSWNWQRKYNHIEECFENCKISEGFSHIVHSRDSGRCYCWTAAPYPGDQTVPSSEEDTYSLNPVENPAGSDLALYYGCGNFNTLQEACRATCSAKWVIKRVDKLMPPDCRLANAYGTIRTRPGFCETKLAIEFRFDCDGYGDGFICCCEGNGLECD